MKKTAKNSLKNQISSGYITIVAMMLVLFLALLAYLYVIYNSYQDVAENRSDQSSTQEAVAAHYQWVENLSSSIQTGQAFTGSLDPATCSLGKWVGSIESHELLDPQVKATLAKIITPHNEIHQQAKSILELQKTNKDAAYIEYTAEIKPKVLAVTAELSAISNRYKEVADEASLRLNSVLRWAIGTGIFLAVVATIAAYLFAKSITNKISLPIAAVADWSKKLSLGIDNLEFDTTEIDRHEDNEIGQMMQSFQTMALSIRDNVRVVKRVADGDMTAFVTIRSTEDSLGKNLYRMVQTNDLMFSTILHIAQRVVLGSQQISQVSEALAANASIQADSVHMLSDRINNAARLAADNASKAIVASDISNQIKEHIKRNTEKIDLMVISAREIQQASHEISAVIKTIDDIAFQTNILALNAAVEAARAGEAGRGFTVVASEVRVLALRSAQAAASTKLMIENTISKSQAGSKVSAETAETFQEIVASVNRIIDMVMEISTASNTQRSEIENVRVEIGQITQAATANAASSQESAASSVEMNHHAETLKQEMSKFNLRQRQFGHAYIPPEKKDDINFVKEANENYRKAMQNGKIAHEVE